MPPSSHIASSSSATRRPSLRPRLARKIAAMPAAFASDSSIATNDSDSSVSSSISPPPVQHHTKSFLNTPVQRLLVNDYFRRLYNAPRRYHRFKAISFKTQPSLLDVETNKNSIYFGFFTLFWMVVALLIIKSMHINYLRSHTLLGTHIINILRRDLFKVALVDLCMYLATYFGVFLQLLVKHSLVSWARTGWIIQNVSAQFKLHFPKLTFFKGMANSISLFIHISKRPSQSPMDWPGVFAAAFACPSHEAALVRLFQWLSVGCQGPGGKN